MSDDRSNSTDFAARYGYERGVGYGTIEAPTRSNARTPHLDIEGDKDTGAILINTTRDGVTLDVTAVSASGDLTIGVLSTLTPRQAEDLAHDLLAAAEDHCEWAGGNDE